MCPFEKSPWGRGWRPCGKDGLNLHFEEFWKARGWESSSHAPTPRPVWCHPRAVVLRWRSGLDDGVLRVDGSGCHGPGPRRGRLWGAADRGRSHTAAYARPAAESFYESFLEPTRSER